MKTPFAVVQNLSIGREIATFGMIYAGSVLATMIVIALPTPLFVLVLRRRYPDPAAVRAWLARQPVVYNRPVATERQRLQRMWDRSRSMLFVLGFGLMGNIVASELGHVYRGEHTVFPVPFLWWAGATLVLLHWAFLPYMLAWGWLARDTLQSDFPAADHDETHDQSPSPARISP